MNLHNQMILDQYQENFSSYETVDRVVKEQLQQMVKDSGIYVNSIESRIKTYKSLSGKLDLKGSKYQSIMDITDIVGARIVTFYSDEVEKFAAQVEKTFIIDWDNSIDKRKLFNYDQFGYMSLHYIGRIPKELYYEENHPEINEIRFEIQIRSILQHAWATIYHDTGYKNDIEVPKEYMRSFMRLSGLLELADENFILIRNSISDYRRRVHQVIKNGKLETIELNIDSFNVYLENGGFANLNKKIATINNMEIEEVSLRNFLKVFKSFGFTTLRDLDRLVHDYQNLAYNFAVRQFSGRDLDIITTMAAPLSLSVVYILKQNMGEAIIKLLLDLVYGERKSNRNQAHRLYLIGVQMGLVEEAINE